MIMALLLAAIACGVAGAFAGNRTAWALLASVGLCLLSDWMAWDRPPFILLMLDGAVIAFIFAHWPPKASDIVIVSLFIPAWAGYFMPENIRYQMGFAVVVAQLLLTFPAKEFWRGLKGSARDVVGKDDFDFRIRAT